MPETVPEEADVSPTLPVDSVHVPLSIPGAMYEIIEAAARARFMTVSGFVHSVLAEWLVEKQVAAGSIAKGVKNVITTRASYSAASERWRDTFRSANARGHVAIRAALVDLLAEMLHLRAGFNDELKDEQGRTYVLRYRGVDDLGKSGMSFDRITFTPGSFDFLIGVFVDNDTNDLLGILLIPYAAADAHKRQTFDNPVEKIGRFAWTSAAQSDSRIERLLWPGHE